MYYLWPTIGSVSFVNGIETPKQIKIDRAVGHLEIRGKYTILYNPENTLLFFWVLLYVTI